MDNILTDIFTQKDPSKKAAMIREANKRSDLSLQDISKLLRAEIAIVRRGINERDEKNAEDYATIVIQDLCSIND